MAQTYATLKSDVALWMRRSDLTAAIPSFVRLAEQEIYKTHGNPLRVREMETEVTLTVTSSAATLPSDYLQARYVKLVDATGTTLFYSPPDAWNSQKTALFTVVGSEIRFPTGATSTVKLSYIAQPAALSGDADTSSVLDAYYGIYLSASLKYAAVYIKDDSRAAGFQNQLDAFLGTASNVNKAVAAGPLVVRCA